MLWFFIIYESLPGSSRVVHSTISFNCQPEFGLNWTYLNVDPIGEEEDEQGKEPFNVSEAEKREKGGQATHLPPHWLRSCSCCGSGLCLHMIYDRAEDIKDKRFSVVSKFFNLVATHTSYSHRNYIFVNCDFIFHHSCDNIPKVEFKFASNTSLTFYLCLIPFFSQLLFIQM